MLASTLLTYWYLAGICIFSLLVYKQLLISNRAKVGMMQKSTVRNTFSGNKTFLTWCVWMKSSSSWIVFFCDSVFYIDIDILILIDRLHLCLNKSLLCRIETFSDLDYTKRARKQKYYDKLMILQREGIFWVCLIRAITVQIWTQYTYFMETCIIQKMFAEHLLAEESESNTSCEQSEYGIYNCLAFTNRNPDEC